MSTKAAGWSKDNEPSTEIEAVSEGTIAAVENNESRDEQLSPSITSGMIGSSEQPFLRLPWICSR